MSFIAAMVLVDWNALNLFVHMNVFHASVHVMNVYAKSCSILKNLSDIAMPFCSLESMCVCRN